VKNEDLAYFIEWFDGFCGTYLNENAGDNTAGADVTGAEAAEDRKNYLLKREHTLRVMENAALIAQKHLTDPDIPDHIISASSSIRTPIDAGGGAATSSISGAATSSISGAAIDAEGRTLEDAVLIAQAAGLFHDVGRFPQYAKYKTFRDAASVNHGVLGAETLVEQNVLSRLPQEEQTVILHAVRYHNAFKIPAAERRLNPVFLKVVRDADKLDIWRVFTEMFEMPPEDWPSAANLGLPDTDSYTPDVLSCVLEGRPVSHAKVRCVNDFKLIQLSWIFDLNFKTSLKMLGQRNYMTLLAARLPRTDGVLMLEEMLRNFIEEHLKS
jgi:hypothetical protein